MPARRCSDCATNWPVGDEFKKCPRCLIETDYMTGAKAIGIDQARSIANHAEFERYYERHDLTRLGVTPEEMGRLTPEEARWVREFSDMLGQTQSLPEVPHPLGWG